jgi:hypothetical protein
MRIWWGYGSEHSMNLVMIGHFATAGEAEAAKELIDRLAAGVQADVDAGNIEVGVPNTRFSEAMLDLLRSLSIYGLGPAELEQFCYDVTVTVSDERLILRTDESEVQAYLKILLDRRARIEVFSAHQFPEEGEELRKAGIRRHG